MAVKLCALMLAACGIYKALGDDRGIFQPRVAESPNFSIYNERRVAFSSLFEPHFYQGHYPDEWLHVRCPEYVVTPSRHLECGDALTFHSPGRDLYLFAVVVTSDADLSLVLSGAEAEAGMSWHVPSKLAEREKYSATYLMEVAADAGVSLEHLSPLPLRRLNPWGGFSVSGAMSPLVAFSAARTHDTNQLGAVSFDTTLVDESGGHFDAERGTFTAPHTGLYYLSLNVGVYGDDVTEVRLVKDGRVWAEVAYRLGDVYANTTLSYSTLIRMNAGQQVALRLSQGRLRSSWDLKETAFMGFQYAPRRKKVAWMLTKTRFDDVNGRERRMMAFDQTSTMTKAFLSNGNTTVTVPRSGHYYIFMSVGCEALNTLKVIMYVNDESREYVMLNHKSYDFRARSVYTGSFITELRESDKVGMMKLDDAYYYGTEMKETVFMGFRVAD